MDSNYMKTILSGVKEWTENLTDDAIDKANNALDKANKSIDKALFVVNITQSSDGTLSTDKTFTEIIKIYNEGKYNIVANAMNTFIVPFLTITGAGAAFGGVVDIAYFVLLITPNNKVEMEMLPLATEASKLPNPYPLTFTGAVSGSYDGSSAKTITIPSGGGGETIIAEETVLASGTIAAGADANQYIDTGVTVGDLRQWEYFGFHIINVNSGAYCSFTLGATSSRRIAWSNSSSIALFKWVTSDKTVLQNTGYVSTNNGETKAMNNMIANFGTSGISDRNSSVFYYLASIAGIADDTKVCITTNNSPTVDITWEIRGLIK